MNLLLPFSAHTLVFNSPKHDCFNAEFDTYTKPAFKNLGFFRASLHRILYKWCLL